MKTIILKILLLCGFSAIILIPVGWRFDSGDLDPFYTRFTTPAAPSLIIGTSRAAQGLVPSVFEEKLAPFFKFPLQNFAFTVGHTPFGSAYLNLIKKKIVDNTTEGLFIVAVDPWAVSSLNPEEHQTENFREKGRFTTGLHLINVNPNFEYILRYYNEGSLYQVFEESSSDEMKLHKDGWLEVNVSVDSTTVQERIKSKVKEYEKNASYGSISEIRLGALEVTIQYLKEHGKVYLVRIPVSQEMADIEENYAPGFDSRMETLAEKYSVPYLNYFSASGEYQTTDGNHLYKEASKVFSHRVASDIRSISQVQSLK